MLPVYLKHVEVTEQNPGATGSSGGNLIEGMSQAKCWVIKLQINTDTHKQTLALTRSIVYLIPFRM